MNVKLCLPPSASKLRALLFNLNAVQQEHYDEQGHALVDVRLPAADWARLKKSYLTEIEQFLVDA